MVDGGTSFGVIAGDSDEDRKIEAVTGELGESANIAIVGPKGPVILLMLMDTEVDVAGHALSTDFLHDGAGVGAEG